jgi:hypothetical protein
VASGENAKNAPNNAKGANNVLCFMYSILSISTPQEYSDCQGEEECGEIVAMNVVAVCWVTGNFIPSVTVVTGVNPGVHH